MGITIQSRLKRIAKETKKWIVDILSKPAPPHPSGYGYKGSKPPEPPRMRSGKLRAGIHYRIRKGKDGWTVDFLSKVPYGAPLEEGWKPNEMALRISSDAALRTQFKARPFLKPGRERAMRIARREFVRRRYDLADFVAVTALAGLKFPLKFRIKMPFKI